MSENNHQNTDSQARIERIKTLKTALIEAGLDIKCGTDLKPFWRALNEMQRNEEAKKRLRGMR